MSESLRAALDREDDVALILDREGRITHVNAAWTRGSDRDGAPVAERILGRPYVDFVAGRMKQTIAQCIADALADGGMRGIMLHGECNTREDFRKLTSHFSPLRAGGAVVGVVVRHSIRNSGPIRERYAAAEVEPEHFRDARGLILQCSCCRRVHDPAAGQWRLSLSLVDAPAHDTTHGLCDACVELYYPGG